MEATSSDHIFPRQFVALPQQNRFVMPLCADCNNKILSVAEETVRNSLAFHYRNTHRADNPNVQSGLRALTKFPGKGNHIERTDPRGQGFHAPKLKEADDSKFGVAVRVVVKKMVLGLEFVESRLEHRKYVIDRIAYAWDIPTIGFRRTFEQRGLQLWQLHPDSYELWIGQNLQPSFAEYAFHIWGNLVLQGRITYGV